MSTNYIPLFLLMRKKKITQKEIVDSCGISPSTFTKMKKGENVTLEVLDKICEYFYCDYSDVITRNIDNNIYNSTIINNITIINSTIDEYIKNKKISLVQFSRECGISYNTLLSIRNGYAPTKNTLIKLFCLGYDFQNLLYRNMK